MNTKFGKNISHNGIMVRILDGKSEMVAQVLSNLGYLICVRHAFRSKVIKSFFFQKIPVFLHKRVKYSELTLI